MKTSKILGIGRQDNRSQYTASELHLQLWKSACTKLGSLTPRYGSLSLCLNFSWFLEGKKKKPNQTTPKNHRAHNVWGGIHTNLLPKVRRGFFKPKIRRGSRCLFPSVRTTLGNRRTSKSHKGRGQLKDKCVCTVKKRKFYHLETGWIKRVLYFPPLLIICWTH